MIFKKFITISIGLFFVGMVLSGCGDYVPNDSNTTSIISKSTKCDDGQPYYFPKCKYNVEKISLENCGDPVNSTDVGTIVLDKSKDADKRNITFRIEMQAEMQKTSKKKYSFFVHSGFNGGLTSDNLLFKAKVENLCNENILYISSSDYTPFNYDPNNSAFYTGFINAKIKTSSLTSSDNSITASIFQVDDKDSILTDLSLPYSYLTFTIKDYYQAFIGAPFVNSRHINVTHYVNAANTNSINDATFNEFAKSAFENDEFNAKVNSSSNQIPSFLIDNDGYAVLLYPFDTVTNPTYNGLNRNSKLEKLFLDWEVCINKYHNSKLSQLNDYLPPNAIYSDASYDNNIGLVYIKGLKVYSLYKVNGFYSIATMTDSLKRNKFGTTDINILINKAERGRTFTVKNSIYLAPTCVLLGDNITYQCGLFEIPQHTNEVIYSTAMHEIAHAWYTNGATKSGDLNEHTYFLDGGSGSNFHAGKDEYCLMRSNPVGTSTDGQFLKKRAEVKSFSKGVKQRISNILSVQTTTDFK